MSTTAAAATMLAMKPIRLRIEPILGTRSTHSNAMLLILNATEPLNSTEPLNATNLLDSTSVLERQQALPEPHMTQG
jgi:hypothetical protein